MSPNGLRTSMRKFTLLLITLLALMGFIVILYALTTGPGVTPDSTYYIASAQSLLKGDGLSIPSGIDGLIPMTHFGPLYPTLLAIFGISGFDFLRIVKWINVVLYTSTIFLVGFIVSRSNKGYFFLAPLASLLVLLSEDFLRVHAYAWSEPIFIFLCTLGLFLFAYYLSEPTNLRLGASISLISLALLTRYAGVAALLTIFLGMIFFRKGKFQKNSLQAIKVSFICSVPSILWFARNFSLTGNVSNRQLVYHPMTSRDFRHGLDAISNWILPGRITGQIRDILLIVIISAIIILITVALFENYKSFTRLGSWRLGQVVPLVFASFTLSYVLFLSFTMLFVDTISSFDFRLLSPILISGIVLVFSILPVYLRKVSWPVQLLLSGLFLLVLAFNSVHLAKFVVKFHEGSLKMYSGSGWQEAEIILQIQALPENLVIYSNGDDAIRFTTGKTVARFPHKINPFSGEVNQDYWSEVNEMQEVLENQKGAIICFYGITWRRYLPSCNELESFLPSTSYWAGDEGVIYVFNP